MKETSDVVGRVYSQFVDQLELGGVERNTAERLRELLTADKPPKADELVSFYENPKSQDEE